MADVVLNPNQLFLVKFSNYCKMAFLACLRTAFADPTTPNEYLYKPEIQEPTVQPNIGIWRAFPSRISSPVNIVIEVSSGTADIAYVGSQESDEEVRDPVTGVITAIRYSGPLSFDVTLTVAAKTTTDRERLTDIVAIYTRHLFRQKLAQLGIGYTKIRIGGETQEMDSSGEMVYTNTVIISVYSEYSQDMPVGLIENINSLNIQVTPLL